MKGVTIRHRSVYAPTTGMRRIPQVTPAHPSRPKPAGTTGAGPALDDPVDALNDLHHEPLERAWLDDLLRAEAKKLAEKYRNKAQQIIEAVFNLLRDSERESRWISPV